MKARLPKGMGGGMPNNMNGMLQQAQKMQDQMAKVQEEVENSEFTASVGGGMVEATVTGKHQVTALKIDPEVIDPDDADMLSDLVVGAVNEAMRKADAEMEEKVGAISGGMGIPGLF